MSTHRIQTLCSHLIIKHFRPYKGDSGHYYRIWEKNDKIPLEPCNQPKQILESRDLGNGFTLEKLECGHYDVVESAKHKEHMERNLLWDNLLPFQKDFLTFAERNNCRAILRDEMGLGKTVQSLSLLRENMNDFTANGTKYCLIVTPVGGIYQWEEEARFWLGIDNCKDLTHLSLIPQVVVTTKQKLNRFSKVVICPWSKLSDKFIQKQLLEVGIGSIICDEAHFFKDERSQRTKALIEYIKAAGTKAPLVFMTGTLVENRIMEMKVALNAIDPHYFYSWKVVDQFCIHDRTGKALSINPHFRERFFRQTAPYMIGRKKSEVNIPLPAFERKFHWCDVNDTKANEAFAVEYNEVLDELEQVLDTDRGNMGQIIGLMSKLRHITGRLKIFSAAVWIEKFFQEHPDEKLAVGIHHASVRESLVKLLAHRNPLEMSSENPKEKDEIERKFKSNRHNLLICSILSAGVGRNFQFCRNALVLERQWNRSKEDQYEQRFHRIIKDSEGRIRTHFTNADKVTAHYLQMKNTIDEYFDSLVHLKGIIEDSSDESIEELPDATSILELAQLVVARRVKFVGA